METPDKWRSGLSSPGDGPEPGKEQEWAEKLAAMESSLVHTHEQSVAELESALLSEKSNLEQALQQKEDQIEQVKGEIETEREGLSVKISSTENEVLEIKSNLKSAEAKYSADLIAKDMEVKSVMESNAEEAAELIRDKVLVVVVDTMQCMTMSQRNTIGAATGDCNRVL